MLALTTTGLITLLALSVAAAPPPPPADDEQFGYETKWSTDSNELSISGSGSTDGNDAYRGGSSDGGRAGGGSYDGGSGNTEYIPVFEEKTFMERVCFQWTSYDECLRETFPDATPEEAEQLAAIPAITITDLARFAPAGTPLTGEPDNLGVAGLPTNFVASASAQTQSGELFGFPIQVRFTPVSYVFHYGDGLSASTSDGGASWESLDQTQFTPTDTSHTYAERGEYDARVDVNYTAELDLGGGWFDVDGQLTTNGPTQSIRIFEAHTALVANTCAERPSAPGC